MNIENIRENSLYELSINCFIWLENDISWLFVEIMATINNLTEPAIKIRAFV